MSQQPRLHQTLEELFLHKDPAVFQLCLNHPDYQNFMNTHGIKMPLSELVNVFTHTSFSHEYKAPHQEQLEFLGDAVLQLVLTEEIYGRWPTEKEGKLSKLRSALVNEKTLATIATYLKLGELILVGRGEFMKRLFEQETVLADTFEALLAQIYRHMGLQSTRELYFKWLHAAVPGALEWSFLNDFDSKSKLQELSLAKYKKLPRYTAEALADKFEVKLWLNEEMVASGVFSSKKSGEKELAQEVLKKNLI